MDESSRHEAREREDRERSPRSPTHHDDGDATAAADAKRRPDDGHPKESIMETFARRWRNADKEFDSDKICTRVWKNTNFLEILVKASSREPTKWGKSLRERFWLSNSAAWGGLEEDYPSRSRAQPWTKSTRPTQLYTFSQRRLQRTCENFAWSELCFVVWPDCVRLWWR